MAMGRIGWVVVAVVFSAGGLACGTQAHARDVSAIVIPGKPGIPVVINGYDASYCIVEGDWGLARPGHVTPTIIACPLYVPGGVAIGSYYPNRGRPPGYGRMEAEPPANRPLPPPAPSFYREWSTQSDVLPETIDPPEAPPLIVAPQPDWRWRRFGRRP